MRSLRLLFVIPLLAIAIAGCASEADMASYNVSKSADQFEINRRIVFINGITDAYLLEIKGLCSLGNNDTSRTLSVTCKTGPNSYKKHFLGLSDNVTFISEQIDSAKVSTYQYKVYFRPTSILPDIDIK